MATVIQSVRVLSVIEYELFIFSVTTYYNLKLDSLILHDSCNNLG